jgi:hypothetical protein
LSFCLYNNNVLYILYNIYNVDKEQKIGENKTNVNIFHLVSMSLEEVCFIGHVK